MIQAILGDKFKDLTSALTSQSGFSAGQAEAFIPEAAKGFLTTLQENGQGLDLSDISNSASTLLQSFDINSLAEKVGISAEQAQSGIAAVMPILMSFAEQHQDKIESLSSMLGGNSALSGILGSLGGKLFGR